MGRTGGIFQAIIYQDNKNIVSVSQDDKSSTDIMPFNVSEVLEWVHCNTETFGMKLSWSYLKS